MLGYAVAVLFSIPLLGARTWVELSAFVWRMKHPQGRTSDSDAGSEGNPTSEKLLKNQQQEAINMSKTKAKELKSVPFFARFLEQQQAVAVDKAPFTTEKFPSDYEEW